MKEIERVFVRWINKLYRKNEKKKRKRKEKENTFNERIYFKIDVPFLFNISLDT